MQLYSFSALCCLYLPDVILYIKTPNTIEKDGAFHWLVRIKGCCYETWFMSFSDKLRTQTLHDDEWRKLHTCLIIQLLCEKHYPQALLYATDAMCVGRGHHNSQNLGGTPPLVLIKTAFKCFEFWFFWPTTMKIMCIVHQRMWQFWPHLPIKLTYAADSDLGLDVQANR